MYYNIKIINARCVGSSSFEKTYENNGIKKTYVSTFVNLVYEDKEDQHLKGYQVGAYKLKDPNIKDLHDQMYQVELMILVSDDGKRQTSVSKMTPIETKESK